MAAGDRLLTPDNVERHPEAWLHAAGDAARLYFLARGPEEYVEFVDWIESVALQVGDDYYVTLARALKKTPDAAVVLRDLARARHDGYVEAWATLDHAYDVAEDDPTTAMTLVESEVIAASGIRECATRSACSQPWLPVRPATLPNASPLPASSWRRRRPS